MFSRPQEPYPRTRIATGGWGEFQRIAERARERESKVSHAFVVHFIGENAVWGP